MNYEPKQIGADDQRALPDYGERPTRRRRWIIGVLVIVVVLIAAAYAYHAHRKPAAGAGADPASADQSPSVTVIVPGRQSIAHTITATGSLAARLPMPVGVAGEGGQITRVLVQPGDWVHAGQVMATIDQSVQAQTVASLAAQVNVAQSDARIAQNQLDRGQALVGRGFISKADLDQLAATRDSAVAKVHVAQAQLAEEKAQAGRLDIRSPAEGLVLTRAADPGQIVSPSSGTLFSVAKDGDMEMRAQLSQGDLSKLSVGVPADVTPVGSAQSFHGEVWQVEPVIDPSTRQGIARIALAYNAALRPGGFASATIHAGAAEAPLLPESAVQSDDQGNYVYVVGPGDKVVRRNVTTGQVSDQGVAIVSGLNGTEHVVASAGAFLNPGQKIDPVLGRAGQSGQ